MHGGGVEGLVGGYQLVWWIRSARWLTHKRVSDITCLIQAIIAFFQSREKPDDTLMVMTSRLEDRDHTRGARLGFGRKQLTIQTVASSAGGTATFGLVAQPTRGHLNGAHQDPFDQEESYARCTVAATRAKALTIMLSPLDMSGLMGMMQVLAARANTVHQAEAGHSKPNHH